MNVKKGLEGYMNDEILIEYMAKAGFEAMHEESWHTVRIFGAEGDVWRKVARAMLETMRNFREGIK